MTLAFAAIGGLSGLAAQDSGNFNLKSSGEANSAADLIRHAQTAIRQYHGEVGQDQKGSQARLRVVYFVAKDREPLDQYVERVSRILDDVSRFYREGLRQYDVQSDGIPLELDNGKLVIHLVRGQHPSSHYDYDSGDEAAKEIRQALQGTINFDREHVLVLYGLCDREDDGRYVFNAPYYGGGSQRSGLCHAADCELLDPLRLKESKREMVYTEHYYPRVEESVAQFNSKYLGGTAHELGHGIGLPHNFGSSLDEFPGRSLMGMGNLTYRQDQWSSRPSCFLAVGTALQLMSHPLCTHSNRGRWEEKPNSLSSFRFSAMEKGLSIEGNVPGRIPAYAMIAHVWPTSASSDHRARTFPTNVRQEVFRLSINGLKPGEYHLKLTSLHVNGATRSHRFKLDVNDDGQVQTDGLNERWLITQAEQAILRSDPRAEQLLSDEAIERAPTWEAMRQLGILRNIIHPRPVLALDEVVGDNVDLSDVAWESAEVGWGQVARNHYWFEPGNAEAVLLRVDGRVYGKGLYAHSPSRYVFALDEKWKTLSVTVGLQDGAAKQGSAMFVIRGDGRELARSKALRSGGHQELTVDVSDVGQLELIADGTEGHSHSSWAVWVAPVLAR